jgi:hypothetical protein
MILDKVIVINNETTLNMALSLISCNWKSMQESGHPLEIKLYEHRNSSTYEQQKLMWVRLHEIAEQVWIDGRQFTAETWHEHIKRMLLPEEDGPGKCCRKGYKKWDFLPNGEKVLIGSTNGLTTFGKHEYQVQLEAFGAELGVMFSIDPRRSY